jgi:HK97 family phage portal protein
MSLFRRSKPEQRVMSDWRPFGDMPSDSDDSGGGVSEQRALSLSYVYAAIRHIVDHGTTLPLDFTRKDGELRRPISPTPLFRNLQEQGQLEAWLGQAMTSLLIHGNAVGYKFGLDGYGLPTQILWLPRWRYSVDDSVLGAPRWFVNGEPVSPQDIVHIPWITVAGRTLGLSPLEHFATTVSAGLNAQKFGARWFKNGGFPPAVFKNERQVLPEGAAEAAAAKLQRTIDRGRPLVTGSDWSFTPVSIPPNQAAFVETQKLTADQVAAIYGVDPTEIGGQPPGSLTYTTDETRQIKRMANIQPYLIRLERAFASVMPSRQFVRFNTDAYIRADIATRYSVYQLGLSMGILNRNTVRANEDLPPIAGGEAYADPSAAPKQQQLPAADQQQDGTRRLSLIHEENA